MIDDPFYIAVDLGAGSGCVFLARARHYFENCYIAGHVDFIFGGSTSFFERCQIHCLKNGYITAASTPDNHPHGFVFSNCRITSEPNSKTYLGCSWRGYASVVFLNTNMSEVVRPECWHNWNLPEREKTSRYGDYNSTGPGANPRTRVRWSRWLSPSDARLPHRRESACRFRWLEPEEQIDPCEPVKSASSVIYDPEECLVLTP